MSYANYGRGMLDYVRSTCDHIKADVNYTTVPGHRSVQQFLPDARDIDGEYFPDSEQVEACEKELSERPEYDGGLRYVNLGPSKIRNLLATETDPREREALERAYEAWQGISPMAFDPDNMGWVDRGDAREANYTTMREMHANLNPVRWEPASMGSLSARSNGPRGGQDSEQGIGLFDEIEEVLDAGVSAEQLYFEAGGWTPPCDAESELDMLLKYDVDEVVSY